MKDVSRRSFMQGMVAAPLAAVVGGIGSASASSTTGQRRTTSVMTNFNVILHGLAAVVVEPNNPTSGVKAFMPDNGGGHKHLVGSFYSDISPNTYPIDDDSAYVLNGLSANSMFPTGDLDPKYNVLISAGDVDTSALKPSRSVVLPYPTSIRTFRYRSRKDGFPFFSGVDASLIANMPKALAVIHVLTYGVTSGTIPNVTNSAGATIWSAQSDPNDSSVGNCHCYNEPIGMVDFCHPLLAFRAFRTINRKTTGIYLHLDFNIVDENDGLTEVLGTSSVKGINPGRGDVQDLAERTRGGQGANCVKLFITPP